MAGLTTNSEKNETRRVIPGSPQRTPAAVTRPRVTRAVFGTAALLLSIAVPAGVLGGCGGDDDKGEGGEQICTPNLTQTCIGPGACEGGQSCNANGTGWSPCDCGSSGNDSGENGSGGSGGNEDGEGDAGAPGSSNEGGAGGGDRNSLVACTSGGDSITIPAVFRDFSADHPDFEPSVSGQTEATTGLVADELGEDGFPVLEDAGGAISDEESFAQWYRDDSDVNVTVNGELVLFDDGEGGYVNRWNEDGDPWVAYENVTWCGEGGTDCGSCDPLPEGTSCYDPCPAPGMPECAAEEVAYDGTPFFFPVDGIDDDITPESDYAQATIPPEYGGNWETEDDDTTHNFHFTSEIRFWFQHDSERSPVIEVTGDDDVWVFVNGELALDLGGIHTPVGGEVEIAELSGLEDGEDYEVAIFQAERQTTGSTLRLRLVDFDGATLRCPTL